MPEQQCRPQRRSGRQAPQEEPSDKLIMDAARCPEETSCRHHGFRLAGDDSIDTVAGDGRSPDTCHKSYIKQYQDPRRIMSPAEFCSLLELTEIYCRAKGKMIGQIDIIIVAK